MPLSLYHKGNDMIILVLIQELTSKKDRLTSITIHSNAKHSTNNALFLSNQVII
jgi:hypothetical protein